MINKSCQNHQNTSKVIKVMTITLLESFFSNIWHTYLYNVLSHLYSCSFVDGAVPLSYKAAYVTPLLKKPDLDPSDARSYRPISNLSVVSKLLERLVTKRMLSYLTSSGLMPSLQSAYRVHHSTETAVFRVMADILQALDRGDFATLAFLDLSAAFDTVDHATLLRRIELLYGIRGMALSWLR